VSTLSTPARTSSTSPPVTDADGATGQDQQSPAPLSAAKTPVGPGVITAVGLVLAVLVIALGVVGVHDALVAAGAVSGTSWIDSVVTPFNDLTPAIWLVPVGIALVLAGLWLLLTALRPRPRTAIALDATTGVFLRRRDVAKLARNAAQDVDAVTSAKATAGRRKVVVVARATTTDGVEQQITQAVTIRLQALAKAPTVRVTVEAEGGS